MESCDLNDVMRAIGKLEGSLASGFDAVNKRLDISNGRLNKHDEHISSLEETRSEAAGRSSAFSWTSSTLAGLLGLAAGLIGSFIQNNNKW
jgi:hypothetical protein